VALGFPQWPVQIAVSPGLGELGGQLDFAQAWPIAGHVALDAPACGEPASGCCVEPDLVDQRADPLDGPSIFAVHHESAAVGGSGGLSVTRDIYGRNVVEGLDDGRPGKVARDVLGRRQGLVVELDDLPIAGRVIVVGVDHETARE